MSFWKKIGKGFRKALPLVGAAVGGYFAGPQGAGIGAQAGSALKGLWGGSSSTPAPEPSGEEVVGPVLGGPSYDYGNPSPGTPVSVTGTSLGSKWLDPSVLLPAAGGVLGYFGQRQTNLANAQQAQKQMDFQAQMSNTSYQRALVDMKAAGLNPMLAYSQGGASTPGGAAAQIGNEIGGGLSSAMQGAGLISQLKLQEAERYKTDMHADLLERQARTEEKRPASVEAETGVSVARSLTEGASAKEIAAREQLNLANSKMVLATIKARTDEIVSAAAANRARASLDLATVGERSARSSLAGAAAHWPVKGFKAIEDVVSEVGPWSGRQAYDLVSRFNESRRRSGAFSNPYPSGSW